MIKKFKILPIEYRKKLEDMSEEAIEIIGVEIFDMESIEELKNIFNKNIYRFIIRVYVK